MNCKEKRGLLSKQVMGDLPSFRFDATSGSAWSVCLMDLWGPLMIHDDVVKKGRRLYKKVWGVLYSCALTRAVHMDVATGYSTEAVLFTMRRLLAGRGNVRMIVSDPGSQLKGASNEMKEWRKGWDMNELKRYGAENKFVWSFIMPDRQHQNGASEILIKMVKGVVK